MKIVGQECVHRAQSQEGTEPIIVLIVPNVVVLPQRIHGFKLNPWLTRIQNHLSFYVLQLLPILYELDILETDPVVRPPRYDVAPTSQSAVGDKRLMAYQSMGEIILHFYYVETVLIWHYQQKVILDVDPLDLDVERVDLHRFHVVDVVENNLAFRIMSNHQGVGVQVDVLTYL